MDSEFDTLRIGIDHCLEILRNLDDFSVQDARILFRENDITVKSKQSNLTPKAQEAFCKFVKEKHDVVETLKTISLKLKSPTGAEQKIQLLDTFGSPAPRYPTQDFRPQMNRLCKTHLGHDAGARQTDHLGDSKSITQIESFKKSGNIAQMKLYIEEIEKENAELKKKQERDTRAALMEELFRSVRGTSELKRDNLVQKLMERNAELIDRLAAEMNARISENESSLENIRIQNRPCRIADEYSALMSNAWLNAKEVLDESSPADGYEKRKNLFLTGILKHSESKAKGFFDQMVQDMASKMKAPFTKEVKIAEKAKATSVEDDSHILPSYVMSGISDYLRERADFVDMELLFRDVRNVVIHKFADDKKKTKEIITQEPMQKYIQQSCRLAWKMAVQRPAMAFDFEDIGKPFDATKLDLALGSRPKTNAKVQYYKYPALLHASKCLVKGVVFVE